MNPIRTGIAAVMLITTMSGCISLPLYYSGQAIDTRVVDADTGEPIPGVNAVAHWELKGGMEGGNVVGQQMILEAVSDENGQLFFPAWGPMAKKGGKLRYDDTPEILLFKPGYYYENYGNPPDFKFMDGPKLSSYWDGRVIKMKRFDGEEKGYFKQLRNIDFPLSAIFRVEPCAWLKIPRMLIALTKEDNKYRPRVGDITSYTIDDVGHLSINDKRITNRCGVSPVAFFRSYQP